MYCVRDVTCMCWMFEGMCARCLSGRCFGVFGVLKDVQLVNCGDISKDACFFAFLMRNVETAKWSAWSIMSNSSDVGSHPT